MAQTRIANLVFGGLVVLGLVAKPRSAGAQSIVGPIAPATRLCQLTGEFDRPTSAATIAGWPDCLNDSSCVPTKNLTETRAGVRGVDLGSSFFLDTQGQVRILFGDTWPALPQTLANWGPLMSGGAPVDPWFFPGSSVARVSSSDSWATVNASSPLDLCDSLSFVLDTDGKYQSFAIQSAPAISSSDVPLGAFEVPAGGFAANGSIYTFFITDDYPNHSLMFGAEYLFGFGCFDGTALVGNTVVCPGGRTVLAKWTGQGSTFTPLYFTSQYYESTSPATPGAGKFLNIAPVLGSEISSQNLDAFLPAGLTTSNTLFLFGSSNWARLSDVYLAVVGLDPANLEATTTTPLYALGQPWPAAWHYFTGLDAAGNPTWDTNVLKAAPLLSSNTAGELSVRYVAAQTAAGQPTGAWLMLAGGGPGKSNTSFFSVFLAARSARFPWGPWSAPGVAFDPFLPNGNGNQLAGYGNFVHGCVPGSSPCISADTLSDPGRENVAGQVYAPYLVPPNLFQTVAGDPTRTSVSFAMSTFNPYETNLMEMQVGIDSDGDGIADFVDNCPTVPNLDQQDSNFVAEQAIDVATNCHGTGCLLPTTPVPTSLGIAEEGRPPQSTDPAGYVAYWQQYYPGDACDANATTGATHTQASFLGYALRGLESLAFDGYIGNVSGTAAQAHSTSGPSFCQCPFAASLDATVRQLCLGAPYNCIVGVDSTYPRLGLTGSGWQIVTGGSEVAATHWERSDTTIAAHTYAPTRLAENWNWIGDLATFGLPASSTSMTGALWSHVRDDNSSFQPGPGEGPPQPNTPNAYVATVVAKPELPTTNLPISCSDAPPLNALQGAPQPGRPPWACVSHIPLPRIWVNTPLGAIWGENTVASPLIDEITSGAGHIVVGDDVAAGVPFGFTGTPALVVQPGSTHILGGLELRDGQLAPVGGVTAPSVGPDPPTLVSYAALQGSLWGLTSLGGATTLARQNVQSALAGVPAAVPVQVVGDTPSNAQAMVWSRGDGNLWAIDVLPAGPDKSEVRFVRVDVLGGASETWRLRETEHPPGGFFLSASGQGEIVLGISLGDHSEVTLLDAHGRAKWSAEMSGSLLSAPVATSEGIGMPMSQVATPGRSNLDVRFIARRDLSPGLCGARWLRKHATGPGAKALRQGREDGDEHRDCEERR